MLEIKNVWKTFNKGTVNEKQALCGALSAFPLVVTGTQGFANAQVTRGGVSLADVDPSTMASRLLISSESSILAIAEEVGYENLSYFNRTFKKRFGMTPRDYRKQSTKQL